MGRSMPTVSPPPPLGTRAKSSPAVPVPVLESVFSLLVEIFAVPGLSTTRAHGEHQFCKSIQKTYLGIYVQMY